MNAPGPLFRKGDGQQPVAVKTRHLFSLTIICLSFLILCFSCLVQ